MKKCEHNITKTIATYRGMGGNIVSKEIFVCTKCKQKVLDGVERELKTIFI